MKTFEQNKQQFYHEEINNQQRSNLIMKARME